MDTETSSHTVAMECPLLAHCIVSAGPGSGKTHFLVSRTARTFSDISDCFCYCVSFTNESSNEIKKRLTAQFPKHGPRIKCSTIHKFCLEGLNALSGEKSSLKILRNDLVLCEIISDLLGPNREPLYRDLEKMFSDPTEDIVEIEVSTDDDEENPVRQITARDLVYMKHILRVSRNPDSRVDLPESISFILSIYRAKLAQMHAVDFHCIVWTFLDRLPTLSALPFPLTHLFVDELQDLDSDQVALILLLVRQFGVTLTAVGDPNQSIYAWRKFSGNQIDTFKTIKTSIPVSCYRLLENYRSDWKIVQASNSLIDDPSASVPTIRNTASKVAAFAATSAKQELELVADLIQEDAMNNTAVLFRYNMDKERVVKILRDRGIAFCTSFKQKVPKRSKSLIQVLWMLRALRFNDRSSLAHACLSQCGKVLAETMKKSVFKDVIFDLTSDPFAPCSHSGEGLETPVGIPFQCQIALSGFRNRIEKFRAESVSVVDLVLQVGAKAGDVTALVDLVGSMPAHLGWDFLATNRISRNSSKLFLGTIHSGKGREWDTVIVPFVNEGVIPNDRSTSVAEERRVMYVAITRAKSKLLLTCTQGGGCQPSRFLFDTQIPITRMGKRTNTVLTPRDIHHSS